MVKCFNNNLLAKNDESSVNAIYNNDFLNKDQEIALDQNFDKNNTFADPEDINNIDKYINKNELLKNILDSEEYKSRNEWEQE